MTNSNGEPLEVGFSAHIRFHAPRHLDASASTEHTIQSSTWSADIDLSKHARMCKLDNEEVLCVLYGDWYGAAFDAEWVAAFGENPEAAARKLNGNWALLYLNGRDNRILIATDRVNAKPLFLCRTPGSDDILVTSSLRKMPPAHRTPDWTGVGWQISNGTVYDGRTPLKYARKLQRACLHEIAPQSVQSRPYWQFEITENRSSQPYASLKQDMGDLIRLAVKRRLPATGEGVLISLSGGYDSACQLGILAEALPPDDVCCFSYELTSSRVGSDATRAKQMAELMGVRHRTIRSYDGDLCQTLQRNVRFGSGVANFANECDVWPRAHEQFDPVSTLFVGDECFGWHHRPFRTRADVMAVCGIRGAHVLAELAAVFPAHLVKAMSAGVEEDFARIMDALPEGSFENQRDSLYLDQRVNHRILPWRAFFASRYFAVCNPWLDNDILEFVAGLPPSLRNDKRLFRETCVAMFPKLFAVPRAGMANYTPSWRRELLLAKSQLLATLQAGANHGAAETWEVAAFTSWLRQVQPRTTLETGVNNVRRALHRLARGFPAISGLLRSHFPLRADQGQLLLNGLSLVGFALDLDYTTGAGTNESQRLRRERDSQ